MIPISARIVDCEQGSADWFKARCGCVTASSVADVIAKLKRSDGESAARRNLRFEKACELLTGNVSQNFVSDWMERGVELEALARAEYEVRFGFDIEQIGFIYHPTIKRAGASPDGVITTGGLLEIKVPKPETHLQYLADGVIPEKYIPQMTWQLACYETQPWNDFVSYCPDMPDQYQIFRRRLERTNEVEQLIRGMEAEVIQFNAEVDALLNQIRERI